MEEKKTYKEKRNINEETSSIIPKIKSTASKFSIGEQVEHKLFGRGKILAIEGSGSTAKLTIQFSGNVRKKLIVKYANLIQLHP